MCRLPAMRRRRLRNRSPRVVRSSSREGAALRMARAIQLIRRAATALQVPEKIRIHQAGMVPSTGVAMDRLVDQTHSARPQIHLYRLHVRSDGSEGQTAPAGIQMVQLMVLAGRRQVFQLHRIHRADIAVREL